VANGGLGWTGLEDAKGHVKTGTGVGGDGKSDAYKYDPYGDSANETSLSPGAKANPLRFEGFYYDAGLKTYDMRARVYRPDIGRFLTRDRYEAASADVNLQTDPLTQNRYAFAGGNPINNVEWDGHQALPLPGPCKTCRVSRAAIRRAKRWVERQAGLDRLNPEERRLCRRHPVSCFKVRNTERLVTAATERLFTSRERGSDGTQANAFKHAYWHALMTRRLRGDARMAKAIGRAHEYNGLKSGAPRELRRLI